MLAVLLEFALTEMNEKISIIWRGEGIMTITTIFLPYAAPFKPMPEGIPGTPRWQQFLAHLSSYKILPFHLSIT